MRPTIASQNRMNGGNTIYPHFIRKHFDLIRRNFHSLDNWTSIFMFSCNCSVFPYVFFSCCPFHSKCTTATPTQTPIRPIICINFVFSLSLSLLPRLLPIEFYVNPKIIETPNLEASSSSNNKYNSTNKTAAGIISRRRGLTNAFSSGITYYSLFYSRTLVGDPHRFWSPKQSGWPTSA